MSVQRYICDVAVIGGGMGGVAAALAAADAGVRVVLTEATDWLGGQMTSQGVSALDEHPYIEQWGGTRSYYALRDAIRAYYRDHYGAPDIMPDGQPLNPGNGWVSRLCFEPLVGVQVLEALLAPHVAAGRLTILREHTPIAATVDGDCVRDITLENRAGECCTIEAKYVLDATELGDLLPLTGAEYVTGAEAYADTGEPHANRNGARPDEVQGFTVCFAVEYRHGENHTIPKPDDYEYFRAAQPYTLTLIGHNGERLPFNMFEPSAAGLLPFWTYRRLRDGALLDPGGELRDVALINWPGNDYHWANIIAADEAERARIIDEAKRLALGFLYWLQTEAPHNNDEGRGFSGLRLLHEIMGTADGLSKAPYIREARRIVALKRIVEGEIAADGQTGARAAHVADSVGVGWYHIDLHASVGNPTSMYAPTLPFQIPLGALVPKRLTNLLAACKNIGTTHITNGAYRLHPVEWNIGEAAGALAAFCCTNLCQPRAVHAHTDLLRRLQRHLLDRGVPLAWTIDLPADDPLFAATQMLVLAGAISPNGPRFHTLALDLDGSVPEAELLALLRAAQQITPAALPERSGWGDRPTWRGVCAALAPLIDQATTPAPVNDRPTQNM